MKTPITAISFCYYSCLRHSWGWRLDASAFSYAFSPALILVLADRRAPHRQLHLALLAVSVGSLDQPLIGQALALRSAHEAIEPRHGVVFDVALVQAESKFIDVAIKMLCAGMMIDANDAALENRENAFHPVRGHAIADVFARAVIDGSVFETRTFNADICASFVGVNDRTDLNVLIDGGLYCLFVGARNRHTDGASAAFAHAQHGGFADRAAPGLELLGLVFVLFDSANIGFINFDDARQLLEIVSTAGFAKPMQDEPSRLLRDTDFLGELHAGDALAGRHKQIHRVNPFVQGNVAPLEYRSGADREVLLALIAAVVAFLANRDPLAKSADRTTRAVRPKATFKVGPGRFLIWEHFEKLESGNRALGHGLTPDLWVEYAPENRGSQVYNSQIKQLLDRPMKVFEDGAHSLFSRLRRPEHPMIDVTPKNAKKLPAPEKLPG